VIAEPFVIDMSNAATYRNDWGGDGSPMQRRRRFFPPEYKAEVVGLIRSSGKTVGQVAKELGLTETAVREWVKRRS
jgi:hypothetical protein